MTSKKSLIYPMVAPPRDPLIAPLAVLSARNEAELTQLQAARIIGATRSAWQAWEYGARNMPVAKFALFKMLTEVPK